MSFNTVELSDFNGKPIEYYKFTVGSDVYRYVNTPINQTLSTGNAAVDGTYTADPVIEIGPVEHARDAGSLTGRIIVGRDNPIAQLFLGYPPDSGVDITVYRKHASDGEVVAWFPGSVRACDFNKENTAELIVEPLLAKMSRVGLWQRFQLTCNLTVYSARCGEDPEDYKSTVTVSSISGRALTVTGLPAVDDGYFNGGFVKDAAGNRRPIELHEGSVLTLLIPLPEVAVSDSLEVFRGCNGDHETCRTFTARNETDGNIANFFGVFTAPSKNPFQSKLPSGGATESGGGE